MPPAAQEALTELCAAKQPIQRERDLKKTLTKRKSFPSADAVDQALTVLENVGMIRRYKEETGGRSVAMIELHPGLLGMREEIL